MPHHTTDCTVLKTGPANCVKERVGEDFFVRKRIFGLLLIRCLEILQQRRNNFNVNKALSARQSDYWPADFPLQYRIKTNESNMTW